LFVPLGSMSRMNISLAQLSLHQLRGRRSEFRAEPYTLNFGHQFTEVDVHGRRMSLSYKERPDMIRPSGRNNVTPPLRNRRSELLPSSHIHPLIIRRLLPAVPSSARLSLPQISRRSSLRDQLPSCRCQAATRVSFSNAPMPLSN
jgi:hypothetical protein